MKFNVVKPSTSVIILIYFGMMLSLPIIVFIMGFFWYGILLFSLWVCIYAYLICYCVIQKIYIEKHGVRYMSLFKSYEMSWDEIKTVAIGRLPKRVPVEMTPYIYFSAREVLTPIINLKMVCNKFFIVRYREKVINSIKLYWNGNIDGLNFMKK